MSQNTIRNGPAAENAAPKDTQKGLKNFQLLLPYVYPYKIYFILGLLLLLLSNLTVMSFPYLVGKLMDAASGKTDGFFYDINQVTWVLVATLLVQAIFSYGRVVTFSIVSENSMKAVRQNLYERLLYHSLFLKNAE